MLRDLELFLVDWLWLVFSSSDRDSVDTSLVGVIVDEACKVSLILDFDIDVVSDERD